MNTFYMGAALALFASLALAFIRVWNGPSVADRMLSAQLFGSTGVALLLVLAEIMKIPALRDVALVLALLAAMAMVAFVHARPTVRETQDD